MSVYKGQGLRQVGAYQVSGVPYITGSNGLMVATQETKVQFPYVTKSITVINSGSTSGQLLVHFNTAVDGADAQIGADAVTGSGHHYITLADAGDSVTFNVKCKEVYLTSRHGTCGFEVFAELTGIPTASMYRLTGSGLTA
tara:strand:+ start:1503 stop:1925 length:423 start_codon:yes stop_codon:yes gene_type:complete